METDKEKVAYWKTRMLKKTLSAYKQLAFDLREVINTEKHINHSNHKQIAEVIEGFTTLMQALMQAIQTDVTEPKKVKKPKAVRKTEVPI